MRKEIPRSNCQLQSDDSGREAVPVTCTCEALELMTVSNRTDDSFQQSTSLVGSVTDYTVQGMHMTQTGTTVSETVQVLTCFLFTSFI